MNAVDFRRLREAFHAVVALAPGERAAQLAGLAAQDPSLHDGVRDLLANLVEDDLQAPASAAAAPLQIGPYRVVELLGSGGMGEVYRAERVSGGFEQCVALKLVRGGALLGALNRRFLRERQILARLEHPNIARLIDGGFTAAGQPWLAMEYVAGERITQYVQRRNLDLAARVALVARVAAAVAYAQRNLVVHRDIKPANILVGADGEPKLLDFGIAKLLDDDGGGQTRTALRAMTARYAAPEQIAGERTTTATDVHALGLLLFELVSGRSPYASADGGDIDWAGAVLCEVPRPLAAACLPAYAPRERRRLAALDRIAQKALAKSSAQRYVGAAALADDLDDWLAGRALRSGIGGAREQTRQLLRRYRWPLIVSAAVVVALGLGLFAALREARIAEAQARVARAHLAALLGVLGAANPQHYAGRDPHASEFLLTAAQTLQREHADDAALLQLALVEIGHGLINLGRPQDAEALLRAAAAELERDVDASAARKLGTYKLLAAVQDEPRHRDGLRATAARIEALAGAAPPAVAIDALGSAAGALSKLGEFDAAAMLFARGDALLPQVDDSRPGARENYLRQRGWSALRAFDLARARDSLQQAQERIAAMPSAFSDMRRAEGELLLAETALAQRDAAAAAAHLAAAAPVYEREFPADHGERARLSLDQAQSALLQGEMEAAQRGLAAAAVVLDRSAADSRDYVVRYWLAADMAAQRGDCAGAATASLQAAAALASLQPALPRDRALLAAARQRVAQHCAVPH
jgi:serine/threonine-protein kinase